MLTFGRVALRMLQVESDAADAAAEACLYPWLSSGNAASGAAWRKSTQSVVGEPQESYLSFRAHQQRRLGAQLRSGVVWVVVRRLPRWMSNE